MSICYTWLAAALALGLMAACSSSPASSDAQPISFDRRAMLANLGEKVVLPTYRVFGQRADELAAAIDGHCAALGSAGEAPALASAQDAWKQAMTSWQEAELMIFGPAAMDARTLRDRIYSWPVTSSCAVDQDVMLRGDDPAYDIGTRLTNRRGLDALEYVLFAPTLETTCPPQAAPPGWEALSTADRQAARCAFAQAAAADLATQAATLLAAWEPAQGNYLGELSSAGQSGSSIDSVQSAVNLVSDAMFYVDSEVKDMKLGEPAGVVMNSCGTAGEPCLAELESRFARHSKENVIANLRGLTMLFGGDGPDGNGGGGPGFDDFLIAVGAAELASVMSSDMAAALAAAEAIDGTLTDALAADRDSVVAAHAAVKRITDSMKSQFLTVLGLELPESAAADND